MTDMDRMLMDIGIVSFMVTELTLFLDTHPTDKRALEYFNHYNKISMQMKKEFSRKYYPLTVDMSDCNDVFEWASAPLPWENCLCNQ